MTRVMSGALVAALLLGCDGPPATAPGGDPGGGPNPPPPAVRLRDMVLSSLPSPYYHFEYDEAGRVRFASFASGFTMYDVIYDGGGISEMRNNTLGNQDRLEYVHDNAGRVSMVSYVHPDGVAFVRIRLSYDGARLTRLERERDLAAGFTTEKTVTLSYYPDGNLLARTEHWPFIAGQQQDITTTDRFEQYDTGINVDAFDLLHSEFFDHLVLLPGVQLQSGNPARVTHTGDGPNYSVDYSYIYDPQDRPMTKNGELVYLTGPDAGRRFQIQSRFTYY